MIIAMESNAIHRLIIGSRCYFHYFDGSVLIWDCVYGSDSVRMGIVSRTKFYDVK